MNFLFEVKYLWSQEKRRKERKKKKALVSFCAVVCLSGVREKERKRKIQEERWMKQLKSDKPRFEN